MLSETKFKESVTRRGGIESRRRRREDGLDMKTVSNDDDESLILPISFIKYNIFHSLEIKIHFHNQMHETTRCSDNTCMN